MRRTSIALLAVIAITACVQMVFLSSATAQLAIEGAESHPLVPMPPGGYITLDQSRDLVSVTWPTGANTRGREFESTLELEGPIRQLEYTIDGHDISALRLYRTYLQHFERIGFEIVFSGFADELGGRSGFEFLTRADGIARQPTTLRDSIAYIVARDADDTTYITLSIFDRQNNRRLFVNVLERVEMDALDLFAQVSEPAMEETSFGLGEPIEEAVPLEVKNTEELESGLVADGRVVVNAILFAFDSADILPESSEALATVADLMRERPTLRLLVVGHTDGVGSFDYNLRLSVDRASAVVNYLATRHAIPATRLRPAGAGPMSPITTNRTEAGRALNRRVELVEVVD